jgi:hypothetical protein
MTEPTREEQIQNMIVINKVLDRVFEQLTPMIRDHVAALGLRPRRQEDAAEQQRLLDVLAEAQKGKETR